MFVQPKIGQIRIKQLKRSDVKSLYNYLLEERGLKVNTIDGVHTVLRQVLTVAVEENYIRINIADNILKELKQSHSIKGRSTRPSGESSETAMMSSWKSPKILYCCPGSPATPCVTPSQPDCLRMASISRSSRRSLATPTSTPP